MTALLRHRDWLFLILIVAAVLVAAYPVVHYPLGRDQGEFATIGRGILDGRIPYVDLWNPKPPAVFYVYAAAMALFGRTVEALRAIDLILYPFIAVALFLIGRRVARARVGLWAALLFGVFYFTETFWTLTQNDGIALVPMTWAVVCAYAAGGRADKGSAGWAFVCGALTVWAMWFKYPFALFVIPVIAAYWLTVRRPRPRDVVGFALGGLLIGVGGILYMMSIGAWDALLESAIVTSRYTALGTSETGNLLTDGIAARLQHWGVLFGLAILTGILLLRGGRALARPYVPILVWLVVGLAIMLVQLKGYDYHWLPMLPALVLFAALYVNVLPKLIASLTKIPYFVLACILGIVILVALGVNLSQVAYARFSSDETTRAAGWSVFVAGDFYAEESERMAQFLRERVTPGDSLFIWGFRPEIYYMSGLNPATRFIFDFPLIADWYPPEWRQQTVDTLWAALPPYVLVLEADYMPWVTGSQEDSHTLLQNYTELLNWLEYNYERDSQIGPFLIWRRLPKSPQTIS